MIIERYGEQRVASWNFESWNEPDHKDFGGVTMSLTGKSCLSYVSDGQILGISYH